MARTTYGPEEAAERWRAGARGRGAARPRRRRRTGVGPETLRAIALAVVAAVGLSLLTIFTFTVLPRYDLPGEPFLDNLDFRDGFAGWQTNGIVTLDEAELGLVRLQNRDPDESVYLRRVIRLPDGPTSLHVRAAVAAQQVTRGDEPWQVARIYLVQIGPGGDFLWNQPFELVALGDAAARHQVSRIYEIPGGIEQAMLGIELAYATGIFEVADLRVDRLEELTSFRLMATLLVAGWCLLAGWTGWRVLESIRDARSRAFLLGTLGVLVAGLFMPATLRHELLNRLTSGLGLGFIGPGAFGHIVVFAALALVVRSARPRDPLVLHASCWVLVGAVSEILQLFTLDRDAQAADWLADVVGIGLGLTIAELGTAIERRLRPPKREPEPDV